MSRASTQPAALVRNRKRNSSTLPGGKQKRPCSRPARPELHGQRNCSRGATAVIASRDEHVPNFGIRRRPAQADPRESDVVDGARFDRDAHASPIGVCTGHALLADAAGPDIHDIARTLGVEPAHLLGESERLLQIERSRSRPRLVDRLLDGPRSASMPVAGPGKPVGANDHHAISSPAVHRTYARALAFA